MHRPISISFDVAFFPLYALSVEWVLNKIRGSPEKYTERSEGLFGGIICRVRGIWGRG